MFVPSLFIFFFCAQTDLLASSRPSTAGPSSRPTSAVSSSSSTPPTPRTTSLLVSSISASEISQATQATQTAQTTITTPPAARKLRPASCDVSSQTQASSLINHRPSSFLEHKAGADVDADVDVDIQTDDFESYLQPQLQQPSDQQLMKARTRPSSSTSHHSRIGREVYNVFRFKVSVSQQNTQPSTSPTPSTSPSTATIAPSAPVANDYVFTMQRRINSNQSFMMAQRLNSKSQVFGSQGMKIVDE